MIEAVLGVVIAAIVGVITYRIGRKQAKDEGAVLRAEADKTLSEAQAKARQMLIEAKDEVIKTRENADRDIKDRRNEISREEDRLKKRREESDQNRERQEQRERS